MRFRWGPGHPGIVAAEAAVVLSAVIVFLLALVDLGRLGRTGDSLTNAARIGAQTAANDADAIDDPESLRAAVVASLSELPGVTETNPTVSAAIVSGKGDPHVAVTVTYDMSAAATLNLFRIGALSRTVKLPLPPAEPRLVVASRE
jgi:hypothetical protein